MDEGGPGSAVSGKREKKPNSFRRQCLRGRMGAGVSPTLKGQEGGAGEGMAQRNWGETGLLGDQRRYIVFLELQLCSGNLLRTCVQNQNLLRLEPLN